MKKPPFMRSPVLLVLAALVVAGGGVALWKMKSAPPVATAAKAVLTVRATTLKNESWPNRLRASGAVVAWQEAVVSSELGGLAITSLPVDVGSRVKRGQELARLSDATLKATLAQQQANVAQQRANLTLAESNAERARQVRGSGALSEQQITQYLQAEAVARANLAAAEAALRLEYVKLNQTRIVAADDGILSARNATLGAVVQPGSELFRLVRQGRLEWRAELASGALERVQIGQAVELTLSNGEKAQGKVRQIAPTFDGSTRKGLVYVDLLQTSPNTPLRAGLFAEGDLLLPPTPAQTLPASAVVLRDGHSYVFEISEPTAGEWRAVRHKVSTGRLQGQRIEIVSDLPAGRFVNEGGAFLSDGDRLSLAASEASPHAPTEAVTSVPASGVKP